MLTINVDSANVTCTTASVPRQMHTTKLFTMHFAKAFCSVKGKIATTYILPHEAKQESEFMFQNFSESELRLKNVTPLISGCRPMLEHKLTWLTFQTFYLHRIWVGLHMIVAATIYIALSQPKRESNGRPSAQQQ